MTLLYEANPPKIADGGMNSLSEFTERLRAVSDVCGGIHITENVLGIRRISPILVGRHLRAMVPDISMTLSVRVRDKSVPDTDTFVADAVDAGFSGILVVAGDPAPGFADSGQMPSRVVMRLRQKLLAPGMDIYLSIPAEPNYTKMTQKLTAHPDGFVTQVVQAPDQVEDMAERLAEFRIMPIVLYPSAKNAKAATFLGIDMAAYSGTFARFISRIHDATGSVLVTSPGDHTALYGFLSANRY